MTKTPKILAIYSPIPPPPALFNYKCSTCRFFIPYTTPTDCQIVCRKGYPDKNIISPTAWCLFWVNKQGEKPFEWLGAKKTESKRE